MTNNDHIPAMVWPLASYLAEEMEARKWTCVDVALRMPGDYAHNVMLINLLMAVSSKENLKLDGETIQALSQAFSISAHCIRNLHEMWKKYPEAQQDFECPEHLFDGVVFPSNDNPPTPTPDSARPEGE